MRNFQIFVQVLLIFLLLGASQSSLGVGRRIEPSQAESLRAAALRRSNNVEERHDLAEYFSKIRQPQKVIELLQPISENLKRKSLIILAKAYDETGEVLKTIRALENVITMDEKDFYAHHLLGRAFSRNKKSEQAILHYRKAVQLNGNYIPSYEALLDEHKRTKDVYEERTLLNDLIAKFGQKKAYLNRLCELNSKEAFLDKALEVCVVAIQKDPKFADNYVYYGLALKNHEDLNTSRKVLRDAANKFPNSELAQWAAGSEESDPAIAVRYFQKAVRASPGSMRSQLALAKQALAVPDYPTAHAAFIRSCKLEPTTINEFRVALAKVRKSNLVDWVRKFEDGIAQCP